MTLQEWMAQANQHKDKLISFVDEWHPARAYKDPFETEALPLMPITAPGAEAACSAVRNQIRTREQGTDPSGRFITALASSDAPTIMGLLNSAWFGVPESTSCWQITGFKEACDLLEDPPDDIVTDEDEN